MYQFYYADKSKSTVRHACKENIKEQFEVTAIRPTMWEEHCLECAAPLCFGNCAHYAERSDGRCKRFENGIEVSGEKAACCKQKAHVKFRKWGNMMTIIFPAMLSPEAYQKMAKTNHQLGKLLRGIVCSKLPQSLRWQMIRTIEFVRRKRLRSLKGMDNTPDAFVFHGYSYDKDAYRLIMEIFDDHTSLFKTSLNIKEGENMYILPMSSLSEECAKAGNLVKIYPENDKEAELDILWCDFVKGKRKVSEKPAKNVKCVVWDLDNTLWDGILIETENSDELKLRDGIFEMIKALDERGIIQSVASKNDFENAWPVLERMGLAEYFLYPQIHWNSKSGSMKEISERLNIGIDSLALIDDSVFEREQVRSVWQQVRTYDVTEVDTLLEKPEFDVPVTAESKNRRQMYKAEEKRNVLMKSENVDTIDFLKKCNLRMEIFEPETEEEKLRCFELVVRTNQLNMSGKKYTKEEYEKVLQKENVKNFAISCEDDFGSYGIVGFGQYEVKGEQLVFTEFAMSCRVAGKYVESALFVTLLEREKRNMGDFSVQKTKKNILLRKTLEEIGFETKEELDDKVSYQFNTKLKHKDIVKVSTERTMNDE